MLVSGLPGAAEITTDALLQKNGVSSWKVTGDRNNNTVFILRLTAQSSGLQLNTHAPYVCSFAWSDVVYDCMVYTERAEAAAVSRGTSKCQRCKHTTSVDIQKHAMKKLVTHAESPTSAVSLLESGEQRYIKAINDSNVCAELPTRNQSIGM